MTETLYGYHPVKEAIRSGRRNLLEVFLPKGKTSGRYDAIESLAVSRHIPVKRIPIARIRSLAKSASHQGICAHAGPFAWADMADILSRSTDHAPWILLLDHIVDPHNLGALIRTAFCAGLDGIVLTKDRCAHPTPAVSKVSAGALEHMLLTRVTNMVSTIKKLKDRGLWVVGLDKHAEKSLFSSGLTGATALIIGGEEKGLRPLVKKHCDMLIAVPQIGEVDSLNASVAGAVAMYEMFRQRIV